MNTVCTITIWKQLATKPGQCTDYTAVPITQQMTNYDKDYLDQFHGVSPRIYIVSLVRSHNLSRCHFVIIKGHQFSTMIKKAGGRLALSLYLFLHNACLLFCTSRACPCTFVLGSADYERPSCDFMYFSTIYHMFCRIHFHLI